MFKRNKWHAIAASVVILLPALFGLIVWQRLPEQLPVHWGVNGQVDGYAPRAVAVLLMPLILLAVHWLCIFLTALDHRRAEQSPKMLRLVLWIIPVLSVFMNAAMYAVAFGMSLSMGRALPVLFGVGFIIVGNLLPKCRQSRTVGIKIKWTLENEENWNATHRFGGRVWVIGGFAMLPALFLPEAVVGYVLLAIVLLLVMLPILYSYIYHKNHP
jgi:uncharacterized membrane protein